MASTEGLESAVFHTAPSKGVGQLVPVVQWGRRSGLESPQTERGKEPSFPVSWTSVQAIRLLYKREHDPISWYVLKENSVPQRKGQTCLHSGEGFRWHVPRGKSIHAAVNEDILQCSAFLTVDSGQLHIVCATSEELPAQRGSGSGACRHISVSSDVQPLKRFRLLSENTKTW